MDMKKISKRKRLRVKQAVTIFLHEETVTLLKREQDRTGSKLNAIMELAVQGLLCPVNGLGEDRKKEISRQEVEINKGEIIPVITGMKEDDGLTWSDIAIKLNKSGYKTPTERGSWSDVNTRQLYHEYRKKNHLSGMLRALEKEKNRIKNIKSINPYQMA